MNIDEDIVLRPGPRRNRDASLPDVDAAMESDLELEPGPGARSRIQRPDLQAETQSPVCVCTIPVVWLTRMKF